MLMCIQILFKFCLLVLKILSGNEILTSIKGRYSVANLRNLTLYNPNLDIMNVNVYTQFGKILSIGFHDIERKRNSDINQGPLLCCKFAKFAVLQSQPRFYKFKCVYKIWLNSVLWFSRY